ncbi:copper-binding protein [Desulfurivibrio alkaliphilus]|uniref:Putative cation efflux system transmembrane protein n=1 Tax=Desulfurivibrio alkaliphilus (strain DSM 19089 / UNIQEM U267 / AHT2) TaxID=589865 RepID=D6Z0C4_DESAT|nr:copper-binding protein [Desulfurivibrio alkaliphilus]ADH87157.1 putative cation efflux system transmembrane protein [Desulfurivibrio alkaliphilus AHT 2]
MKKTIISIIAGASIIFALSAPALAASHGHGGHGKSSGATADQAQVVTANGVVTATDPAGKTITLNHEPIPALNWPAMTMDLDLADPALAKGLQPGDKIVFELKRLSATDYVIIAIHRSN